MVRFGAGRPREYRDRWIFTTSVEANLFKEFINITEREGKPMNHVLQELMAGYIKIHASGNPTFEITKWIEQPEFMGDPAIRETNEKWDKYLLQCDDKDLSQLEGTFKTRAEQAKNAYLKKKGFRK